MPQLVYSGRTISCDKGQTVLDALLAESFVVPYSCKAGSCQTCLLKCVYGRVPEDAKAGVKDTLLKQGYFLPCLCHPTENLFLQSSTDTELFSTVTVRGKNFLSEKVCQILVESALPLYYHAGQFVNLRNSQGVVRSYSLASVPKLDKCLEFHVARYRNGSMSSWLHDSLEVGQTLDMSGPMGNCFYLPGNPSQDILLIGTGTGLAPLLGIVRDALATEHKGNLLLFHGSQEKEGLYLHKEITELARLYKNFYYYPCLSKEDASYPYKISRADDLAFTTLSDLQGWRVFLCGSPPMVNGAKRKAFLLGAGLADIYADPFEVKELRSEDRKQS
ncbi:MAG: 2Fe-2S iron-sulfur cluster-binding protein [Sneathiella sp.]